MDLGRRLAGLWNAAAKEAGGPDRLTEILSRLALFFSGGWILALTFFDWIRSAFFVDLGLTVAILVAFALGIVNVGTAVQTWIPARRLAPLVPLSIVYFTVVHYWLFVSLVPFYGTDGLAFSHYSAILLLQGQNPYAVSQAPALELFRIPEFYVTPKETGGLVTSQTYPALSFLIYVPVVAAGATDMRIVSLAGHGLAILVAYRVTPQPFKAFAPLTLAFPDQLDFTPGSVQDILWVAPLLLSVSTLHRRRFSGCLYGIACSIKQMPWLLAPFLFVDLWKRDGTKFPSSAGLWNFAAFAAGTFLLINGPFILWDPGPWTAGVLDPLFGDNIPLGPGLSILTQGAWLLAPKAFYSATMVSVIIALLALEFIDYPNARRALYWFPGVVMFFAYRNLQNYFVYWYPFVFLALATWLREQYQGSGHAEVP